MYKSQISQKERINITKFIELDTSFKATKPYCYCCVNSILNNESVTIAIIIGLSETKELYETCYKALINYGIDEEKLNSIPVLSDMGKGLISFCKDRNIKHFYCHRHIIERFGHPVFRNWVQRILKCPTEDSYDVVCIQIHEEIKIWCSQFEDQSNIPLKLLDVQLMLDKNSCNCLLTIDKFALWKRLEYSVVRCSNHSESLHRVFNYKCIYSGKFETRITKIFQTIIQRYTSHENQHGRSIRNKYNNMMNELKYCKSRKINISNYCKDNCNCGWSKYYSSIYGTQFPCKHEIGNDKYSKCPDPPPLILTNYSGSNAVEIITCECQNMSFEDKKNINVKNRVKNNEHYVHKPIGPKSTYAREEMWKIVYEIQNMFDIDRDGAIDIALGEFLNLNLGNEENATVENVALLRVLCWNTAKEFNKH